MAVQVVGDMGVNVQKIVKTGAALRLSVNASATVNGSLAFDLVNQNHTMKLTTPQTKHQLFSFTITPHTYVETETEVEGVCFTCDYGNMYRLQNSRNQQSEETLSHRSRV